MEEEEAAFLLRLRALLETETLGLGGGSPGMIREGSTKVGLEEVVVEEEEGTRRGIREAGGFLWFL